ncbi:MAG: hypothetical protein ACQESR_25285 [Planctomycetota bacterium]
MNLTPTQRSFLYALLEPDPHGFHFICIDWDRPVSWFWWVDLELFYELGWIEYKHGGENPYFPDTRVWVTVWLTEKGYREAKAVLSPAAVDIATEKEGDARSLKKALARALEVQKLEPREYTYTDLSRMNPRLWQGLSPPLKSTVAELKKHLPDDMKDRIETNSKGGITIYKPPDKSVQ